MTRRELLSLPAGLTVGQAGAVPLRTANSFLGVRYREYFRCLPEFLLRLARHAYQMRNRELAKLTTPQAIRKRQVWARHTFWRLIGGMPERTPLNARTLGSFERPGYRVEKVLYESRPRFFIPANLYIPTAGKPPFPGVLFQMGHTLNGKAGSTYQSCCQGLAKLGYLVLAFDPMGQGERVYYPGSSPSHTRFPSADDEHTVPGKQMLLVGDTATRMQVWDAVRSLDYLASLPLVDTRRIGVTGQSGGGTLTMLLVAVDDRLSAAVVCSGNTENVACAGFNPPGSTDDAEQDLVGSGPEGFDRWDVLYPFAPKPLLISVSDKDFFGTYSPQYISSGWEEFQKLRKVYEVLGRGDHLAWTDTPLPHGLSYDTRLQIYNWFGRHLKSETTPIKEEPAVKPEPDQTLWVSESGSVVTSFHSETPVTLIRSQVIRQSPLSLERLLRVSRPASGLRATVLRRVPSRGADIAALDIPSAPGVWLPAWLYIPHEIDPLKPVLLALEPSGRNVRWHEGELYQQLARKGCVVCVPDVRGIGDMVPEYGRGSPRYARSHESEEAYAWSALILGRPLLGQRVTDILAVASALREHPAASGRRMLLAAQGWFTVPALFAGALDPRIDELYLSGGLGSFRSIIDTEEYNVPLANFVPHLLSHTDLPDVAAGIAPRRVRIAGTVNAAGAAMETDELRSLYGSAQNVVLQGAAQWDMESLLE